MITIAKQKKSYYKGDVTSEIVGLIEYTAREFIFQDIAGKVFLWKQRLISERYTRIKSAVFHKVDSIPLARRENGISILPS